MKSAGERANLVKKVGQDPRTAPRVLGARRPPDLRAIPLPRLKSRPGAAALGPRMSRGPLREARPGCSLIALQPRSRTAHKGCGRQ